ncbi:MAG: MMPL family transporter [Desulfobacteraceae bacterium]|nr:MMPL family transporter [Desulfobacteraceae bacterium]
MGNSEARVAEEGKKNTSLLERMIFSHRLLLLVIFGILTVIFAFQASRLDWKVNFVKMIPTKHPFIQNYLEHKNELKGFGDSVRIAVETTRGTIIDAEYMSTLEEINDEVFFYPGVKRAELKSLWTPQTRWRAVSEEGFAGGPVIPNSYDGSERSLGQLKANILRSGEVGSLVANNFKSSIIRVPLYEYNQKTGEPLDYYQLSQRLENLREKYETADIKIHITGFAKIVGELIEGVRQVSTFFLVALLITLLMLYGYSRRCGRSTIIPVGCSIVAVIWELGLIKTLGYGLDPYSILVPFLIFAIGVSHGVQIINGIHHEVMQGTDKMNAARRAFRKLSKPGFIALITDCLGFATLMIIQIHVIQELAIGASVGVFVLILTNLILLPILMSYAGINPTAAKHIKDEEERGAAHAIAVFVSKITHKKAALTAICLAIAVFGAGYYYSQGLRIGQMGEGAAELRPNSRYNQDVAFMNENYSQSTNIFVVMVNTPPNACDKYHTLVAMDRLQSQLGQLPQVLSTSSLSTAVKKVIAGFNEGNVKWMTLTREQGTLSYAVQWTSQINRNQSWSLAPIRIYLDGMQAHKLEDVVDISRNFAQQNNTEHVQFLLAAGNAGIEAATNMVVSSKQYTMLIWIFSVIAVLCFLTFRSLCSVASIVLPLALTTVLCRVVMTLLGVGVTVATLPVIALGVGVGVDYGIYVFSYFQSYLNDGLAIPRAYYFTLKTTGKAVIFTGLTLAVGVCTWVFSPIKFQADMGILLTFMFIVNMIGAIVLLPAIASLWFRIKGVDNDDDEKQAA